MKTRWMQGAIIPEAVALELDREYAKRTEQIRLAAQHFDRLAIAQTMARYELESDEFQTAEDKARKILRRQA